MGANRLLFGLCAAAFACLCAGCVSDAGSGPGTSPGDIAAAKALWRANEPARYSYSVRMVCFCPIDTVQVTANRDSVLSAVPTNVKLGGNPSPIPDPQVYSMDSIFARLEGMERSRPYKLRCRFDPRYGFPDSVSYDGSAQAVDDELDQTIFDFRVETAP